MQNVSKILKCNSLKTSLVKRVLVFCWVHEIIVTGSGLIKRISEHASSKSKKIARFKNEFIKRESQSSIVYIIKTETQTRYVMLGATKMGRLFWFDFYSTGKYSSIRD